MAEPRVHLVKQDKLVGELGEDTMEHGDAEIGLRVYSQAWKCQARH